MRYSILKHTLIILIFWISIPQVFAVKTVTSADGDPKISLLLEKTTFLVKSATNHDSVSVILDQAEELVKRDDTLHQSIDILLLRGLNDYYSSKYEEAVEIFFDALNQAEQKGDSLRIARANQYLGQIFDKIEEYDEAITYFQKSIKISQSLKDTALTAKTYQYISNSYQNKKDLGKALEFNQKAIQLARIRKDTLMIIDLTNNFGTIAYTQKDLTKSLDFYQEALALYRKINNQQGIAMAYNNIGLVYLDKKEYQKSIEYLNQSLALANKLKMYDFIAQIYSNLTMYYAGIKDFKNAYEFYDKYNIVYDSLVGEKKSKMIRQIQAKYQVRKSHQDLEELKQKNEVQLKSINNARSIQIYLLAIILIAVVLMVTIIYFLVKEKKLAIQLKDRTDELKELNASKDKFFSIIAHDLRNPFNILVSYTSLLKTDLNTFSKEQLEQIIDDLNKASENGFNLLQNLLLWTRSQTNRIRIYKTSFLFHDVIEQVKDVAELSLTSKNQKLIIEIKPDQKIFADKDMVSTVLRNLVFNAMKFSERGSAIQVKTSVTGADLQIDIIDRGTGIPPETLNKLFRLDNSFSTNGTDGEPGTGLGLVICREFVEKNDGKIWVKSELGKGSVFSFTLPLNVD